ncbi:MAG: glycosyltransferase [Candidatus Kapabacteria bacterium]|jgi:glycosyltransferase involved in cell wall biosynthesis|nr:glycosyltransferase [Candidatus Kapabacteria bacterium]
MINILYISHFPNLSMGGQQSMFALIKNLDKSKFKPFAIVPAEGELKEKLIEIGCTVFVLPLFALKPKHLTKQIKNIFEIRKLIKKYEIDIVHPDHERDSIIAGLAKKNTKAKMIWHVRLTRKTETDKLSVFLSDGIIGIADDVKSRFDFSKSIDTKYATIYNGVDCNKFIPFENISDLRRSKSLPLNKFIVSYVGQFKRGKGILELLSAAVIVNHQKNDGLQFLLVGKEAEENFLNEMNGFVKNHGISDIVKILPQQDNIHMIMQASDVLVLPSHEGTEGMGRVLFESMACGVPVIGTDVKGVREAITVDTGIVVPEKDSGKLAEAILKFFDDDDFRTKAAVNGRSRALEYFDIKNHTKKVQNYYLQILNHK